MAIDGEQIGYVVHVSNLDRGDIGRSCNIQYICTKLVEPKCTRSIWLSVSGQQFLRADHDSSDHSEKTSPQSSADFRE